MNDNNMSEDDIRQIISLQLIDFNIQPGPIHYEIAISYYHRNGTLPGIDYILDSLFNNANNQIIENHVSDTTQLSDDDDDDDDSSVDNDDSNYVAHNDGSNYVAHNGGGAPPPITVQQIVNYRNTNNNIPNDINQFDIFIGTGIDANINDVLAQMNQLLQTSGLQIYDPLVRSNERERGTVPPMIDVIGVIKDINSIPLAMYKSDSDPNKNTECLICYDKFVDTDIIRVLKCSHSYHRSCIDDHLIKKTYLCPYCKNPAGEHVYRNL